MKSNILLHNRTVFCYSITLSWRVISQVNSSHIVQLESYRWNWFACNIEILWYITSVHMIALDIIYLIPNTCFYIFFVMSTGHKTRNWFHMLDNYSKIVTHKFYLKIIKWCHKNTIYVLTTIHWPKTKCEIWNQTVGQQHIMQAL